MYRRAGFTLIELLVVISIIALIASIILASLKPSRDKSYDAAIKQELTSVRSQAELYFSKNGNFGTAPANPGCLVDSSLFVLDPNVASLVAKIEADNGPSSVTCYSTTGAGGAWAVSSPLRTDPTKSWCVDSKQSSKQISGSITTTSCP